MFIPNTFCVVHPRDPTTTVFGEYTYGPSYRQACAVTQNSLQVLKSSVRADSSASRGRAEEEAGLMRLLLPADAPIKTGDIVHFDGEWVEATRVFYRHDVLGKIDHIQVDLRKGIDLTP